MSKSRLGFGFVSGAIMALSVAPHSLVGWPTLRASLERANAPADLITGLALGWHFAGVSMLAFGCIVIATFVDVARRRPVSLRPAQIIAALYTIAGVAAFLASGRNPFFLVVFLLPGLLLGAAVMPSFSPASQSNG